VLYLDVDISKHGKTKGHRQILVAWKNLVILQKNTYLKKIGPAMSFSQKKIPSTKTRRGKATAFFIDRKVLPDSFYKSSHSAFKKM
jgi:hypothetical protein